MQTARVETRPDVTKLRARIDTLVGAPHSQKGYWGVLIADRDTGEPLVSLNQDHFFTPASNAKIFTTALALATLGPDYRFRTTLESKGIIGSDGRLGGDLILVGRGDPDLSNRKFPYDKKSDTMGRWTKCCPRWPTRRWRKGLEKLTAMWSRTMVIFRSIPIPRDGAVGDLFFRFGSPVSAIAFNDNTVSVYMRPGAGATDAPAITVEPAGASDTFGVELATVGTSEKSGFAVVRQPGTNFLLLRGTISPGHAPMRIDLAMPDPAKTAAAELKALLEARGVRVTGAVRVQHGSPPMSTASGDPILTPIDPATNPSNPTVLAEHLSQPLIEIVRITNKVSQNLHAELLLRTVGREKLGVGSTAAGLKVEKDFLKDCGNRRRRREPFRWIRACARRSGDSAGGGDATRVCCEATVGRGVSFHSAGCRSGWHARKSDEEIPRRRDSSRRKQVRRTIPARSRATPRRDGGGYLVFSIFVNNTVQHGSRCNRGRRRNRHSDGRNPGSGTRN